MAPFERTSSLHCLVKLIGLNVLSISLCRSAVDVIQIFLTACFRPLILRFVYMVLRPVLSAPVFLLSFAPEKNTGEAFGGSFSQRMSWTLWSSNFDDNSAMLPHDWIAAAATFSFSLHFLLEGITEKVAQPPVRIWGTIILDIRIAIFYCFIR